VGIVASKQFKELLAADKVILFDGAMGTMLQSLGLEAGELPELYNIHHPEKITEIHQKYLDAGAQIMTTNTFGANSLKLAGSGYSVDMIINAAVANAHAAVGKKLIALDIGPLGQLLAPLGRLTFDEAYQLFKEQAIIGETCGVDLVIIETIADLYEAKAAILAVKENTKLPVICTMTFEQDRRTYTGTDIASMVTLLAGLGVDALGVNCSLGPVELLPIVSKVLEYSPIPVIVQANAGLP
jgi:5-methyltetrahydrofolate--homocysteine methyltransferase